MQAARPNRASAVAPLFLVLLVVLAGVGPAAFEGDSRVVYSITIAGANGNETETERGRFLPSDSVRAVAINAGGGVLAAGATGSRYFPLKEAFDTSGNGFAVRFAPNGSVVYSTYVGGSGRTQVTGAAWDPFGNAYLAGFTESPDFQLKGASQPKLAGQRDAFLLSLAPDGTLRFATYFGGSGWEESVRLALGAGSLYLSGTTNSTDLPLRGAPQATNAGDWDGWLARFTLTGQPLGSTYLGGSSTDVLTDLAVNNSGSVRLAGYTYSPDFPARNAAQPGLAAGPDAVVASVDLASGVLEWSTYHGGASLDAARGVAVDGAGSTYVVGRTRSDDLPVLDALQDLRAGASDAFLAKFGPDGALRLATYHGGSGYDQAYGVALDPGRNPWFVGGTTSPDFPTRAALDDTWYNITDFYLDPDGFAAQVSGTAACLGSSTYLGGYGHEELFDVAVSMRGRVALGGVGHGGWPTTMRPFPPVSTGGADGVLAVLHESMSDANVPCTQVRLEGTPGGGGWWVTEVHATFTAHCACTVAGTFHALGEGPFENSTQRTIGEGDHPLRYHSTSLGGAVEALRVAHVPVDLTPPAVTLLKPAAGDVHLPLGLGANVPTLTFGAAAAKVEVQAAATDALSGVERVDFYVDGRLLASDRAAPYNFTWDANAEALGAHTVVAEAWDVAGHSAQVQRTVYTVPTATAGLDAGTRLPAVALPGGGPLVGAHIHSSWFEHDSPLPPERLAALAAEEGLELVSFGVPLGGTRATELAPRVAQRALAAFEGRPAVVQLNTFRLHEDDQDEAGLRALFRGVAPAVADPDVLVVVGGNEPLSQGKDWLRPEDAEARVRLEHRLWHEASDEAFCHKFTSPKFNDDLGWDRMERLWAEAQDAVCYVWYEDTDDTATLQRLRETADGLGKPLHILEARVPGNDPVTLRALAAHADTFAVYHLVGTEQMDARFPAFVLRDGSVERTPVGTMLRAALT